MEINILQKVDYDLHGIVGIRLVNPGADDVKKISKLLSPFKADLIREPDINIVFKDNWHLGDLTYLGLNAGYNKDGFYILSSGRAPLKVRIPFNEIGEKCEIICEQGIVGIPLLNHIINLTFLRKNYLPIHASAFSYNDCNALVIGWSKGGKSEALFSFMKHGAQFIGDETVVISADGSKMFGIPVPVSIWEWQFQELSKLMPPIGKQKNLLFKGIHILNKLHKALDRGKLKNLSVTKLIGDALPALRKQLNIRVAPDKIFGSNIKWRDYRLDKVILAMSNSNKVISTADYNVNDMISRMMISILYEFDSFYNFYSMYKFAFPGYINEFIENVPEIYKVLLPGALSGIDTYKVVHPYPVSFEELFNAMEPIISKRNVERIIQ